MADWQKLALSKKDWSLEKDKDKNYHQFIGDKYILVIPGELCFHCGNEIETYLIKNSVFCEYCLYLMEIDAIRYQRVGTILEKKKSNRLINPIVEGTTNFARASEIVSHSDEQL
jgi:hypothetical protein